MLNWVYDERPQEFLQEFMQLDARAEDTTWTHCTSCHDGLRDMVPGEGVYRCRDCWGVSNDCLSCILASHRRNPFHRILVRRKWLAYWYSANTRFSFGMGLISRKGRSKTSIYACNSVTLMGELAIFLRRPLWTSPSCTGTVSPR